MLYLQQHKWNLLNYVKTALLWANPLEFCLFNISILYGRMIRRGNYILDDCFITPKVHCLQDEKSAACINVDKRIGQRICSTVFIPCMSLCKSSFGSWRRKNRRGQIIKSSYCFFPSFNRHVSTLVWEKVNWLGANVLKLLIHQEKKNHVMFLTKRRVRFQPIERRPY